MRDDFVFELSRENEHSLTSFANSETHPIRLFIGSFMIETQYLYPEPVKMLLSSILHLVICLKRLVVFLVHIKVNQAKNTPDHLFLVD